MDGGALQFLFDGPADAPLTVALAHGAGAPMDSPFMTFFAEGLGRHGWRVARFEFPYMVTRRAGGAEGKRRPPDPPQVLIETWHAAIDALASGSNPGRLVIGGKSLGGRIASMVADEAGVRGLVCLGYPFHPPGKPVQDAGKDKRIAHLCRLRTQALIVQGTRDPFGLAVEIMSYRLPPSIRMHWVEDGDHSFKPRKASKRTEWQNLDAALETTLAFISELAV